MLKLGYGGVSMKIINNLVGNHLDAIESILKNADKLYIVSPFMSESPHFYSVFFQILKLNDVKEVVIVTTLEDNSPDLLKKSNALYFLAIECFKANIKYSIHIDNKLHGKLYISKVKENYKGIITSANFTESGLKNKHEWGVEIEDKSELIKIIKAIELNSILLTYKDIEEIIKRIDVYKNNNNIASKQIIRIKVADIINKNKTNSSIQNTNKKYFIKPVGWSENPFSINRKLSASIEKLHFAKRPAAIEIGDIIICYGVGTRKLLGYFEVISDVINLNDNSRWEWEVEAKNLYPKYSNKWNDFNLTLSQLQSNYSGTVLTYAGGGTLGGLQRGLDKIRLDQQFANYLIGIIESTI